MVDEREMDAESPDAFVDDQGDQSKNSPPKQGAKARASAFMKPLGNVDYIGGLKTVTGVTAVTAIANMAKRQTKTPEEIEKEMEE